MNGHRLLRNFGRIPLRERAEVSCTSLLKLIQEKHPAHMKEYLRDDYYFRASELSSDVKRALAPDVLRMELPQRALEYVELVGLESAMDKVKVDVAIVTIIREELDAAKIAVGIQKDTEDLNISGLRYWGGKIARRGSEELSVVLTMVGESRTLPCAIACDRLFGAYSPKLCILVGIAGGVKDRVALGDAVSARLILDYEGARLEPKERMKRPQPYSLEIPIGRDLYHFRPRSEWNDYFGECLLALRNLYELPSVSQDWHPKHDMGVILAGEKLFADGSLPAMQKEYHQEVLAAEMEGSGFARACQEHAIPWLVFRGISDYGDPDKPAQKAWKATAALSAATAAVAFLKTEYRPR